ncbi:hypothetical protein [Enterobacter roggenkampii]|uniref:hypothetical protein n=1 Tax=Enterobacter roggenkampii TaxID=1812935 RepID=UPI0018A9B194|nr:hypothetical protein [Enterobacter roggenkampii]
MKLIDILVQELHKLGGWPDGVNDIEMLEDGSIFFDGDLGPEDFKLPQCSDGWNRFKSSRDYTNSVTREQYEAALAASKTEWDGRGLPPSGVEFEYLRGDFGADEGRWVRCTMKYAGDKFCIVHLEGEGESWLKHEGTKIRPIRSEADKKRAEAAKGLIEYLDKETDIDNVFSIKDVIGFYDAIAAGKIPHIRID